MVFILPTRNYITNSQPKKISDKSATTFSAKSMPQCHSTLMIKMGRSSLNSTVEFSISLKSTKLQCQLFTSQTESTWSVPRDKYSLLRKTTKFTFCSEMALTDSISILWTTIRNSRRLLSSRWSMELRVLRKFVMKIFQSNKQKRELSFLQSMTISLRIPTGCRLMLQRDIPVQTEGKRSIQATD